MQQYRPAAFTVRHRLCVGLVYQRSGIAAVQRQHQLTVMQVLQQLTAGAIGCQLRRGGYFTRGKLIPRAEPNVMRLKETAVVIDRAGTVTQPGQYAGLQSPRFDDGVEQRVPGGEFKQRLCIKRPIEQVGSDVDIGGFNDEHVAHHVRRRLGFAHQGQIPNDHCLPVGLAVGSQGFYQRCHIAGAQRCYAVFVFET